MFPRHADKTRGGFQSIAVKLLRRSAIRSSSGYIRSLDRRFPVEPARQGRVSGPTLERNVPIEPEGDRPGERGNPQVFRVYLDGKRLSTIWPISR